MPRYKEYNEIRVVEKAMYKFWMDGFGASSLEELTEEMKINKFSFYAAFQSKEHLLLVTMNHYFEQYFLSHLGQLRENKNISEFIMQFLLPGKNNLCGCYILSITAETGKSIDGAVEILDHYVLELRNTLAGIVSYFHPEMSAQKQNATINQLLALCTSIPMIHAVKSKKFCIDYIKKVLTRLNMNQPSNNAKKSQN